MPWSLETVNRVMRKNIGGESVQWCIGRDSRFTYDGINYVVSKRVRVFPRRLIAKGWMNGIMLGCLQQESSFWTRELYERVGGIDISYKYAGDYQLWKKFATSASLFSLNSVLAGFRIHKGQKSGDVASYLGETSHNSKAVKLASKCNVWKIISRLLEQKNKHLAISVETIE